MTTKCSITESRSSKGSTRARAARSDIDGRELVLSRARDSQSDLPSPGGSPGPKNHARGAGHATATPGIHRSGPQALGDLDRGCPPWRREEVHNTTYAASKLKENAMRWV